MDFRWSLGPTHFTLKTDVPDIVNHFRIMFGEGESADTGKTDLGSITIRRAQSVNNSAPALICGASNQRFALADGVTYIFDKENSLYHVSVDQVATGQVTFSDNTACWELAADLLPRTAFHILVLDPLSLFAPRDHLMICHGAAVTAGQNGVLLFGVSGVGKSTLTFLLSHETESGDIRAMTDDTLILDFDGRDVRVWPIQTGFGLSPDILNRWHLDLAKDNLIQQSRGKWYLKSVPSQASFQSHPVRAVIFLDQRHHGIDGTHAHELGRYDTLRRLIDSQTSIAMPYATDKLDLWLRLAKQARGILVSYTEHCDTNVLRKIIREPMFQYPTR